MKKKKDLKIGDVVYIPGYYVTGVIVGIMGIYCKVKNINYDKFDEEVFNTIDTELSNVFWTETFDWVDNICPWKRRDK